jgi:hypothetical protein
MIAGSALTIGNNTGNHVQLQQGTTLKETIAVQNKIQYSGTCEYGLLYLIVRSHRWCMFENRVLRSISNHE